MISIPSKYINRLSVDELKWELIVRGQDHKDAGVDELRSRLRGVLKQADLDPRIVAKYPKIDFNVGDQLLICDGKLQRLNSKFDNFKQQPTTKVGDGLTAKLNHLLARLGYLLQDKSTTKEDAAVIKVTQTMVVDLLDKIEEELSSPLTKENDLTQAIAESRVRLSSQAPLTATAINYDSESDADGAASNRDRVPQCTDRNTEQAPVRPTTSINKGPLGMSSPYQVPNYNQFLPSNVNTYSYKPDTVSKWNIKFTGDLTVLGVNAFLERVEEMKVSRRVPDTVLFESAFDLFESSALVWFRANRSIVNSWSELVDLLKYTYLPHDYDESLWDEIRNRKQGVNEAPHIFIAYLQNLMGRLSEKPSIAKQIRVILQNLQPRYSDQLIFHTFESIQEILSACKNIVDAERRKESFMRHQPTLNPLEPDLAAPVHKFEARSVPPLASQSPNASNWYQQNRAQSVRHQVKHEVHSLQTPMPRYKTRSYAKPVGANTKCFNCRDAGHTYHTCKAERRLFCYFCGTQNVGYANCPRCQKNVEDRE